MALGGLFKKLFGGGGGGAGGTGKPMASVEYNGFTITPEPLPQGGQYNTAGVITKPFPEGAKEHRFVRADAFSSRDDAAAHAITKAQQIIDEQGDRMFR
jgi:hypothetical protein